MTITDEQLAEKVTQISVFCIQHRGRCFPGWCDGKVFRYLCFHYLTGTLLIARAAGLNGVILGVGVAWLADASEVKQRELAREPQFNWKLPNRGDALVIAEVFGDREASKAMWQAALRTWPNIKTVFAERAVPMSNRKCLAEYPVEYLNKWLR